MEPAFDPPPTTTQHIKIGAAANFLRPDLTHGDFSVKDPVAELFAHLSRLGDGSVTIEIRHGLPHLLHFAQQP